MAFTASCPKCQKQVLVPEGECHDAVVQCPLCSGEYSLGEIFASAPPALIVIHPGSTGATAPVVPATTAAASTAVPASGATAAVIFPAHRVEPVMHDAEPLLFAGDEVQLVTPAYDMDSIGHAETLTPEEPEHIGEVMPFAPSAEAVLETDQPIEALAEPFDGPFAAPLSEESHDLSAEPADGSAPWGGAWGGFKDESKHEDDETVGFAEPHQDEALENVDFAEITGKATPRSGLAASSVDAAVAAEPGMKKKRKREANMVLRVGGMLFFGLLALPCAYGIAIWVDHKNDYFHFFYKDSKPTANTAQKAVNPPANSSQTSAASTNPAANATPNSPDAGKASQASGVEKTPAATNPAGQTPASGNQTAANASVDKKPSEDHGGIAHGETKPGPTPDRVATSDLGKGGEAATGGPTKNGTKATVPSTAKPDDEPSPFSDNANTQPKVKPDAAPVKPDTAAKPDADPFGSVPDVASVNEKNKTDSKPEAKPDTKPDVAAPANPEPAVKPDADPFGPAPQVTPVNEKSKTDTKPDVKPEAKPEVKSGVKPDVAAPANPEPAVKPDADPFGPAPQVAPVNEKGKTDTAKPEVKPDITAPAKPDTSAKPDADPFGSAPNTAPVNEKSKTDTKPDVPAPVKPEMPPKLQPESGANPSKTLDLKPDTAPVIGPEPKPDVKPEAKPDVFPAVSPAPDGGPLQAPSFSAADLDASLKAVSSVTTVDAKSYADWCKLAEVVTYVKVGTDVQKQALRTLTEKVASSPQAVSAIAASAKKLFDDKATKGGIVLAGTVTAVATKNGLSGTAIRMEGMTKPVMVLSAKPLDIKESQKVIVFGALVAEPAKNLPGYHGTQPVVVWADFATAIP
ncbi:MAG: hypothetical protein ABSG53_08265 [Thermoguttaceae bacterium]